MIVNNIIISLAPAQKDVGRRDLARSMSQSTAELIKEKLSITDVVSGYVELTPAGRSLKGKCPFHREKTPSFFVSPDRGTFYCFGCGQKGDIFSFVQEYEKVDFSGALKMLAEKAGVDLRQASYEVSQNSKSRDLIEEAALFFEHNLYHESVQAEKARVYLLGRGLTEKTIKDWHIGLSLNEWHSLEQVLIKKGHQKNEIENAGLIKQGDKGMYDRFRNRIMFPISDQSGRMIAFTGRIMPDEPPAPGGGEVAKYLNSPDTPVFNKSEVLYGFDKAKHIIREKKYAVLVEGQMDLLMSHQAGFENTVATSGTALTIQQLEMIKRMSPNLMLVYDADKAGINATMKAWLLALQAGMEVKVALLPQGKDPADVIRESVDQYKEALRNSKHVISYIMEVTSKDPAMVNTKDSREKTVYIREKILPYIKSIPSPMARGRFIDEASLLFGISNQVLSDELQSVKSVTEGAGYSSSVGGIGTVVQGGQKNSLSSRSTKAIRLLFGMMMSDDFKKEHHIIENAFKALYKGGYEAALEKQNANKDMILFELDEYVSSLYSRADKNPEKQQEKALKELLFWAEEGILEEQFEDLMAQVQKSEKAGNFEEVGKLLEECKKISESIAKLRLLYEKKE